MATKKTKPRPETCDVTVTLQAESLAIVFDEKDRYKKMEKMGGKPIIIHRLLCELYKLKKSKI